MSTSVDVDQILDVKSSTGSRRDNLLVATSCYLSGLNLQHKGDV